MASDASDAPGSRQSAANLRLEVERERQKTEELLMQLRGGSGPLSDQAFATRMNEEAKLFHVALDAQETPAAPSQTAVEPERPPSQPVVRRSDDQPSSSKAEEAGVSKDEPKRSSGGEAFTISSTAQKPKRKSVEKPPPGQSFPFLKKGSRWGKIESKISAPGSPGPKPATNASPRVPSKPTPTAPTPPAGKANGGGGWKPPPVPKPVESTREAVEPVKRTLALKKQVAKPKQSHVQFSASTKSNDGLRDAVRNVRSASPLAHLDDDEWRQVEEFETLERELGTSGSNPKASGKSSSSQYLDDLVPREFEDDFAEFSPDVGASRSRPSKSDFNSTRNLTSDLRQLDVMNTYLSRVEKGVNGGYSSRSGGPARDDSDSSDGYDDDDASHDEYAADDGYDVAHGGEDDPIESDESDINAAAPLRHRSRSAPDSNGHDGDSGSEYNDMEEQLNSRWSRSSPGASARPATQPAEDEATAATYLTKYLKNRVQESGEEKEAPISPLVEKYFGGKAKSAGPAVKGGDKQHGKDGYARDEADHPLVQEKLRLLENEIARYRSQAEKLKKKSLERDLQRRRLEDERSEFETYMERSREEFEREREAALERVQKERRVIERQAKANVQLTGRKDREELVELQKKMKEMKEDFKVREARWKAAMERLERSNEQLKKHNEELEDELSDLNEHRRKELETIEKEKEKLRKQHQRLQRDKKLLEKEPLKWSPADAAVRRHAHESAPSTSATATPERKPALRDRSDRGAGSQASSSRHGSISASRRHEDTEPRAAHAASQPAVQKPRQRVEREEEYEEIEYDSGKKERRYADGRKVVLYSNGTRKSLSPDGHLLVNFGNGDVKEVFADGTIVYFYASANTTQVTYSDGLEVYEFSNGQVEKQFPDGMKEIVFPDKTVKRVWPNGSEENIFPDGMVSGVEIST